MAKTSGRAIRSELLIAGQELAQSMGVSEFSYADLAERVGIRSASIHHHFAKKEDLVAEIARRYRTGFNEQLKQLEQRETSTQQLQGYRDLFQATVADGKLCLCGSAAAEWSAISDATRAEVQAFFVEQKRWLSDVVAAGMSTDEFSPRLNPDDEADLILSALEGATLLARVEEGEDQLGRVFDRLLAFFTAATSR